MEKYVIIIRSEINDATLERIVLTNKNEAEEVFGVLERLIDFAIIEKSWK